MRLLLQFFVSVAATTIGIDEFEDQYEWALRRVVLGWNFWEDHPVCDFLRDDLIHPKAKARYALLLSPATVGSAEVR